MAKRTTSSTERALDDLTDEFRNLVDAMEEVFSAASGDSQEKLADLKDSAQAMLKKARAKLEKTAIAKARKLASDSDDYVHDNPWTAIGAGVGVGVLLGLLIGRK